MTLEPVVRCRWALGARFQGADPVTPRSKNGPCLHRRQEIDAPISYQHIMPHHIISYRIVSYHIVLYRIVLYRIIWYWWSCTKNNSRLRFVRTSQTRRSIITWQRLLYCQQVVAPLAPTLSPWQLTNNRRRVLPGVPVPAGAGGAGCPAPPGEGAAPRRCSPRHRTAFVSSCCTHP